MLHPQSKCKNLAAFKCVICRSDLHSGGQPTVWRFVQNPPVSDLKHPDLDELKFIFSFASVVLEPRIGLRPANISSNGPSLIYQAIVLEGRQGFRRWALSDVTRGCRRNEDGKVVGEGLVCTKWRQQNALIPVAITTMAWYF